MKILDQCLPGRHSNYGYTPTQKWPEDCSVQWGEHGINIDRKNQTVESVSAFFEAFPKDPYDTFLRGEGKSLADAEADCFAQLEKIIQCPKHEFERRGRIDDYGYCKLCGFSKSGVFEPLMKCEVCHEPCNWASIKDPQGNKKYYCQEHDPKQRFITDTTQEFVILTYIRTHQLEPYSRDSFKDIDLFHFDLNMPIFQAKLQSYPNPPKSLPEPCPMPADNKQTSITLWISKSKSHRIQYHVETQQDFWEMMFGKRD